MIYAITWDKTHQTEFAEILARLVASANPDVDEFHAKKIIISRLEELYYIDENEATIMGELIAYAATGEIEIEDDGGWVN